MATPTSSTPYFCYMNQASGGVPYFEVLPECSPNSAVLYAARLLREHEDCESVDLWRDERLMLTLSRADLAEFEARPHLA